MMRDVASLWIGSRLGEIELASIRSFQRLGHSFTLYSYNPIENVPNGTIQKDARDVFDAGRIIRHKRTGSPALHSDLFRYRLLEKTDYIWVDLDIIALRTFDFTSDFVFGFQDDTLVDGAVLCLPSGSAVLKQLLRYDADTKSAPPNLRGSKKARYQIRNFIAGGLPIDRWPWGSLGPTLLTSILQETGEIEHAMPVSAFYSVSPDKVAVFAEPKGWDVSQAPPSAYAVHLWGKFLRDYVSKNHSNVFPKDSFVARLAHEA